MLILFFLFNFCVDVFWYSCLTLSNLKFDDFIDKNKHTLFHKLANNITCQCQQDSVISEKPNPLFQLPCQQGSVISEKLNLLFQFQWNILFTFNPDVFRYPRTTPVSKDNNTVYVNNKMLKE